MKRSLSLMLAVVMSAALGLSACGNSATSAAKVNGTVISQSSLDDELQAIKKNKKYVDAITGQGAPPIEGAGKGTFNTAFVAQILNQRILLTVVKQELDRRKITVTDEDRRLAAIEVKRNFTVQGETTSLVDGFPKSYRDDLAERSAEVLKLQAALAGVPIDDKAVQTYYDQHKDEVSKTCVRHILVDTKAKADAIRARVAGGEDFAAVAKAESSDKGSAAQGGDVGCDLSQFVPEFKDAAAKLGVNEISQPVQSQFGFHIIQVTSRNTPPLNDETKVLIRQQLAGQDTSKLQDAVFTAIDKAKISVSPKIGTYDKGDKAKGQPPQVVPNVAPATTTTTAGGGTPSSSPSGSGAPSSGTPTSAP